MTTAKKATAYRLSTTAKMLIEALAKDMGVAQTAVIEVAVRDLAKSRKIEVDEAAREPKN